MFTINSVYWTMAVEVQFYAVLPLCAIALRALAQRWGVGRASVLLFGGLILISLGVSVNLSIQLGLTVPLVGTLLLGPVGLPYWMGVFACGMAARVVVERYGMHGRRASGYGALVGALVIVAAVVVPPALHHARRDVTCSLARRTRRSSTLRSACRG